jgi:hypothetical protein
VNNLSVRQSVENSKCDFAELLTLKRASFVQGRQENTMRTRQLDSPSRKSWKSHWAGIAALVLFMTTASPAYAQETTSTYSSFLLRSPATGVWFEGGTRLQEPLQQSAVASSRLNGLVIGLCNAGASGLAVSWFSSSMDGLVDLKCGTSSEGYIHIRNRHQTSWELQKGSGMLWDDYMVWATAMALSAPSVAVSKPDSKRCYTTPIQVFRYNSGVLQLVKIIYPTVIVSINNKVVITSYPSNKSNC